jgi:hypothetical protein
MDSRKKQYEQNLPLAESGAAIVSPSVTETSLGTKKSKQSANRAAQSEILPIGHFTRQNSARSVWHTIAQTSFLRKRSARMSSSLLTAYPVNGTMQNSRNRAESVQFAERKSLMDDANTSTSTIGIAAVKSVLAAASAFAAYCVCAVTLLLSAWNPIEIGQKRLSPILGGTHV